MNGGPISNLIATNTYIHSTANHRIVKRTWINSAFEYSKKYNIDLNTRRDAKESIKELFKEKRKFNKLTVIGNFRNILNLNNGSKLLKEEVESEFKDAYKLIIQIRTGTLQNRNQLIGRKEISNIYRGKCLICKEFKEDKFLHWISDCSSLTNLRNKYLTNIRNILQDQHDIDNHNLIIASLLLGAKFRHKNIDKN